MTSGDITAGSTYPLPEEIRGKRGRDRAGTHWRHLTETGLCRLAIASTVLAIVAGIALHAFDYDEMMHTHISWSISQGRRPFYDFFESHPPFLYYPVALLLSLTPDSARILYLLRGLNAIGGAVLLVLIAANSPFSRDRRQVYWLVGALLLTVSRPPNIHYLFEVRPDLWANSLVIGAFLLFRSPGERHHLWRRAVFACIASIGVLCSPKMVVLVVLFSVIDLAFLVKKPRPLVKALAGYLIGCTTALLSALVFFAVAGLSPVTVYDLVVVYNGLFIKHFPMSHGLFHSVISQPVQATCTALGIMAWTWLMMKGDRRPQRFEVAAVLFVISQLFLVRPPHKQYFVPVLLLGAVFIPYIGVCFAKCMHGSDRVLLCVLLLYCSYQALHHARLQTRFFTAGAYLRHADFLNRITKPGGRIICPPQDHPIFQQNVFYAWYRGWAPDKRCTEWVMAQWNKSPYAEKFTPEFYRQELVDHPPALVLSYASGLDILPLQEPEVEDYLAANKSSYVRLDLIWATVWVHRDFLDHDVLRQYTE